MNYNDVIEDSIDNDVIEDSIDNDVIEDSTDENSEDSIKYYDNTIHPTISEIIVSNKPYFNIIRTMSDEQLTMILKTKKIRRKSLKSKSNVKMCNIICAFVQNMDPIRTLELANTQLEDHYNFSTYHVDISKTWSQKCCWCKLNLRNYCLKIETAYNDDQFDVCTCCLDLIVNFSQNMIVEIGSNIIIYLLFLLRQTPIYNLLIKDIFFLIFKQLIY